MQPDDSIKKRARKVVDAGSVTLAHLQESIQTNELLQEIVNKEEPDYFEINLENLPIAENIKEPPVDTSKIENLLSTLIKSVEMQKNITVTLDVV